MTSPYRNPSKRMMEIVGNVITDLSSKRSLITVTYASLSTDGKVLSVGVSVLPEKEEMIALEFLNRQKQEFGEALRERLKIRVTPKIMFSIDAGEKNRQRIQEISSSEK